jgi:hypothetical protein
VTSRIRHTALCTLAAAAFAVGGCTGGDDGGEKLPPGASQELLTTIERIEARVEANVAGACDDIFDGAEGGNFDETARLIESIPEDVDPDIRSALSDSVDRLQQLVSDECDEIQAREAQDQETVPEETVPKETAPTEPETTPTVPETTPTEPDTGPPPPQDDGSGNGQGPDGNGPPGQQDDQGPDGGGLEVPE